ncbi:hypothetical protein ACP70R_039401 [Stipagrostis hirtigluma subsp. patula]
MESDGEEGGATMTYDDVDRQFNTMEGPSAQERIDYIIPFLLALLPPPFVPVPDAEADSDSDDDRFSLTSSDSEASDGGAGHAAAFTAPGDGEDHIGRLPDTLLANIIHRLPTNDAGRTAALSPQWRRVWRATPLLVDDAHFARGGAGGPRDIPVVRALSRCVAAHPGPVGGVRITRVSFYDHEYPLGRLVAALADKGVQDLILFNRPWPLDMPLPADILRCTTLHRLYLGVWKFPKTTAARPPAFPHLRELGLFHSIVRNEDLDALLAHSPKLEVLSVVMSYGDPSRLRLASHSLEVAVDWMSFVDEVVVQDAPCLKRLLFESVDKDRLVKIVRAPKLEVLGFLDLSLHVLEIGGTVIRAGVNVGASAMVPSLKILAVKVKFACNSEAKMLPTLLRCFPCLETLHIMSMPSESPDMVDDLKFWDSRGPCECLQSHLKTVVFHGRLSHMHEVGFLKFIMREAKVLKTMGFIHRTEKGENFRAWVGSSNEVSLAVANPRWSFQNAIDSTLEDPFYLVRAEA